MANPVTDDGLDPADSWQHVDLPDGDPRNQTPMVKPRIGDRIREWDEAGRSSDPTEADDE